MMLKLKDEKDHAMILQYLQIDMNEEFKAVLQYICHRILAKSIDDGLAEAFKSASLDEMSHILFFSDLITKYGGTPEFTTWDIDKSSTIKVMLEKDIALEQAAVKRYEKQIGDLQAYPELVTILTSVLNDEEDHKAVFLEYLKKQ